MKKVKTAIELKALCDDLNTNLHDIDTSDITDMSELFKDSLRSDFSFINTWDTSNVNDMNSMFENCVNLNEKLEIDVSSLRYTDKMFYNCTSLDLKNISFNNFDVSNLSSLAGMLVGCINRAEFITRYLKLNFLNGLLLPSNTSELEFILNDNTIPLNLINTSKLANTNFAFTHSDRIDFSGIDSWGNINSYTFANSKASDELLKTLNIEVCKKNFKYIPATKVELKELVKDENIYLGDIDTSLITDMSYLFYRINRRNFSGINKWNTSNVTNMAGMFYGCIYFNESLSLDTRNVTNMVGMFYGCESFNQKLYFNTSNVESMKTMFCGCSKFNQKLDFDTKKVKYFSSMFDNCSSCTQTYEFNCNSIIDLSRCVNGVYFTFENTSARILQIVSEN
ncbi:MULTISPECIES: BspA family leucine-rich repeat surface protein [unclassified Campylobacter]|uniref:BspA family leucine-rich repeat surface protein n=1 Tax=unclassified Campylobacter TaxID=2593542 RepID=UPI001BDAEDEF|nr:MULTISPECIES: BspA family leucine-rich repeat surface protein [unclassified Campylobacter]MBT0880605.1 BspA family leucine-rich repeat surface protein [Campylobacter sp. 2018MI27]MBT0885204.1 BspA family leucine-rich repeat surface protein [Campylobacter sp. 2018MI10]